MHKVKNKNRKPVLWLIGVIFITGTISSGHAAGNASCKTYDHLTFGILPFITAEQLVERFTPLAQYLHKYLQVPVRIETAPDFMEFARRTHEQQRYDILFTAPHFFPLAQSKADYRLIAGVDSPGMRAIIVVPVKSDIHTLNDLKNKRLATVHPMSLASLLVKKHLISHGIRPDVDLTMVITPTHDASLLSSYHGVTDASSLMRPPYEAASKTLRDSTRIIAETESAPHIPISVSPRISDTCKEEITRLLLKMDASKEGETVLKHNRFAGFKHVDAKEYERVRDYLIE